MTLWFFCVFALVGCAVLYTPLVNAVPTVINRDTVILGGGSTGTYAAVRLKDLGKSVIIVERNDYLGGHGETYYTDDGRPIDYGVVGFFNTTVTLDYLDRLNVPYEVRDTVSKNAAYVNLRTGQPAQNPADTVNQTQALQAWIDAISQFKTLDDGLYQFPDPIPEDLLITFGEFVEKYHLENSVPAVLAHGSGNIIKSPTLYVIQYVGVPNAAALRKGYIRPVNGIADLYTRARTVLDPDVLYKTTAEMATRSEDGVAIYARFSNGTEVLIRAKNILVTIPPTLDNLAGFDLSSDETKLFSKWQYQSWYALVVNQTGLPDDVNIRNIDPDNGHDQYSVPDEPFIWHITAQGVPGYHDVKLIGDEKFSPDQATKLLNDDFERMAAKGTYNTRSPHIVAWGDHTPLTMTVTPDEIRQGFYEQLYKLQGQRSTFYTGSAWCSDYSTLLWGYTDEVLKQMLE